MIMKACAMKRASLMLAAACMLGAAPLGRVAAQEDVIEAFDCETYLATAPVKNNLDFEWLGGEYEWDYEAYLTLDTNEVKTWNLGTSMTAGFSCSKPLLIEITGGKELTIISTAESAVTSNVRFQVMNSSKLVLDVPDLTITSTLDWKIKGAVMVYEGCSMDFLHKITIRDNILYTDAIGGAGIHSRGDVKFYEKAYFKGNSLWYSGNGYDAQTDPGSAVQNWGTMEFMKKATFTDNHGLLGGNGGAVANSGTLIFNLRAIFRRNTVGETNLEGEDIVNGRGAALFNGAYAKFNRGYPTGDSTVLFKRKAIFHDNVGALGGCALTSRGGGYWGEGGGGTSKITFEDTANFKDNICDGDHPAIEEYLNPDNIDRINDNKGGGAVLAYGPTTVEFLKTANFKRNEAPNGGAIRVGSEATISFISDDEFLTEDNAASTTCPDILVNEGAAVQIAGEAVSGDEVCQRT